MTIKKLKLLPLCNSILSLVHLQEKITKIIQIYSAHTISLPDKSTFLSYMYRGTCDYSSGFPPYPSLPVVSECT